MRATSDAGNEPPRAREHLTREHAGRVTRAREEGGPHPPQVWSGLTSRPSVVYSDDIDTDCACPLSLTLLVHQIIISPQLEANVSLLAPTLKDLFPDQTQMFTSLTSLEI